MNDCDIIALYLARDELAISETADKYGNYCFAIADNILSNDEDAEECVNDTYLKAWNSIPPIVPHKLSLYLGKITRNLSLDKYSRRTAGKRGGGEVALALDELTDCLPDCTSVEREFEDSEIALSIDRFLAGLPRDCRVIFVRRYWHLCPLKEIAADMKLGESKVKKILYRTRIQLREHLAKDGISI